MENFECRLLSINSYHQTESDGDEIFIKINNKKIWPVDGRYSTMNDTRPAKINHTIPLSNLGGNLEVELWEYDNILSSTCLGKFSLVLTETGGPFNTDLKLASKEFARYSLSWELVKKALKI